MPDTTETPKIRLLLKMGEKPEPDAPMLGFVRWKLVPLPPEVPVETEPRARPRGRHEAARR